MGKQIINGDVEITGQLLKGDLKALYHLGAYDSVDTSNADYDLITRGTGYVNKKSANLAYYTDNNKQRWEMRGAGAVPPASLTTVPTTLVCNYSTYTIKSEQGAWDDNSGICITSSGGVSVYAQTLPDDFEIQYQLSSTHTEKVLKNQPLSQLDQNGENWLRGMYEKTLNLFGNYIFSSQQYVTVNSRGANSVNATVNNASYSFFTYDFNLDAGSYVLSFDASGDAERVIIGSNTTYFATGHYTIPFTIASSENVTISFGGQVGTTDITHLSINAGSTALPYQPYNGPVMHAVDVEGVKLWENGNPTSNMYSGYTTISNIFDYSYIDVLTRDSTSTKSADQIQRVKLRPGVENEIYLGIIDGSTNYHRMLNIKTDSTVQWGNGYISGTENSAACIISAIYGIK